MPYLTIDFPETIRKTGVRRENQILSSEMQRSGLFPVVDQGQAFISGYSDDQQRVVYEDLPVVVFGDHTRCVKYIDFPFILGADGTKVLKPREELFDARFFYYALLSLDIPNRGYNRHFSILREMKIPKPERHEQHRIAAVLRLVEMAIEQQDRLFVLTTELRKTLLHRLFTQGLRGEVQKQTDVGPVPLSWRLTPVEQAGDVIYGIQAAVASKLKPLGTKILTNKNITLDGKIDLETLNYFELKTARHHATILKKGDILFNWRSGSKEHVGKTAYFDLEGEYTHSSFILRIRPHDEVTGRFLFYYLTYLRESGFFVKSHSFSINAKFNKSAVNMLPTFLPSKEEREEIIEILDAVEQKLAFSEHRTRLLKEMFRALLHDLMSARVHVADLDLSELETTDVATH